MPDKLIISPKTRIGELLDAYPQLESVLLGLSPVFSKLKNPVLRRTVAKVATIQQISVVGGIPVDKIINTLRKEVGQADSDEQQPGEKIEPETPPSWFDEKKIVQRFDATPVINSGESPMNEVLKKAMLLKPGEIFELRTPFVPAPIIDKLRAKGFLAYSLQQEATVRTYFIKSD